MDGWMDGQRDRQTDIDDGLHQIENKLVSNVNTMRVGATGVAPFAHQALLWCIYR
jgi:hypothetical protein